MRVLHVNAGNMYGGVESFLVTLARKRDTCPEMEPNFAFCFEGRYSKELTATAVRTYLLGSVQTRRFWTIMQARRRMRELLKDSLFDGVVCHMPWNYAVFGPEVRRAGVPLIFWAHGLADGSRWLERWARRTRPDLVLCNSRFTGSTLAKLFPGVESRVIYYPVEKPQTRPADAIALRRELNVSEESVVILQVSRMEPWKGHSLHLRALAQLKNVRGWKCWIAGGAQRSEEEEYFRNLQRQAAELGIGDRVRFMGQRTDVARILAAADIFCQPNEAPEPFGIAFIEALWSGLPVVSTAIGGGAEIVTATEGFLTPPGDPHTLADCLRSLIESADLRRKFGEGGPARARQLCDPGTQIRAIGATLAGLPRRPVSEHAS